MASTTLTATVELKQHKAVVRQIPLTPEEEEALRIRAKNGLIEFTYTNNLRRTMLNDFLAMRDIVTLTIRETDYGRLYSSYTRTQIEELRNDLKDMEDIRKKHPEDWKERIIETYDYLLFWTPKDNLAQEIYELQEFLETVLSYKGYNKYILADSAIRYDRTTSDSGF